LPLPHPCSDHEGLAYALEEWTFLIGRRWIMQLLTRKNGGETPLQEVADAWKREEHNFVWSKYETDAWAVEYAKKIQQETKEAHLNEALPEPVR
jgi:hypothetical protein